MCPGVKQTQHADICELDAFIYIQSVSDVMDVGAIASTNSDICWQHAALVRTWALVARLPYHMVVWRFEIHLEFGRSHLCRCFT